ncbi:MAG TPA: ABC transporter substrate-binding protein [Ilumatobacter sp.]|nr:ABC transporter substrate-binding protein [Ilumatobacter sp.]
MRRSLLIPALVAAAVFVTACGDDGGDPVLDTSPDPTSAPTSPETSPATDAPDDGDDVSAAAACAAEAGTFTDGVLTIATGEFAFPPYVLDDAPESKQGFEAAVAYAVAGQLGFADDQVTWVRTGFDEVIAPGEKEFDFNLQQYTITPERANVVDFSEGYYSAAQAVLGYTDSPAAGATSVADLKGLKIGVQASTTSLNYIEDVIQPDDDPLVYNDNAAAKAALDAGQIDAIVADLPTALYITAVEIENTTVFGQIEGSGTDEFGLLLAKDNPLTECLDLALQALKADGTLDAITEEWMAEYAEAPLISAS